jgi:hypothetical protein
MRSLNEKLAVGLLRDIQRAQAESMKELRAIHEYLEAIEARMLALLRFFEQAGVPRPNGKTSA